MSKSKRKPRGRKAAWSVHGFQIERPYADFPLTPHYSGKWMKRIRGDIVYFGKWGRVVNGKFERLPDDGWEDALKVYKAQADDLHAGRTPRLLGDGLTVMELCNRFLTAKKHKLDVGKMSARMFAEYKATAVRLASTFGKTRLVIDLASDDFESLRADLEKQYGPVRLGNEVQKVRTIFKYALGQGLIDKPVQMGDEFKKPSKSELRKHRAARGKRLFTAEELRRIIETAGTPLKAMILLGINAAFGNADCGHLPQAALDLEGGWVTFPRPKTGIERRAYLWPETVAALRQAIAERPQPKNEGHADLVFVTKYGRPWSQGGISDAVTQEMGKLLHALGINGRHGLGFYALRHTFRTVADATRDFPAVRLIMGHADGSIDDVYREGIDDARLRAAADYVHAWLWSKPAPQPADKPQETKPQRKPRSKVRLAAEETEQPPALRLFVA